MYYILLNQWDFYPLLINVTVVWEYFKLAKYDAHIAPEWVHFSKYTQWWVRCRRDLVGCLLFWSVKLLMDYLLLLLGSWTTHYEMLGAKIFIIFNNTLIYEFLHSVYQIKSVSWGRALPMTWVSPGRTSVPLHRSGRCRQYIFLSKQHALCTGQCERKMIYHGRLRLPFLA